MRPFLPLCFEALLAAQGKTTRDSDQRYLAAAAWLNPSGESAAVLAAASDASLQLLAFHVRPKPCSKTGTKRPVGPGLLDRP